MSADHPVEVYRTTNPELVAAWHEANESVVQWRDKVGDFAIAVTGTSEAWFNGFLDSQHCTGLVCAAGEDVPLGWRRHKDQPTRIVPNLRIKAGKEVGKQFASLGGEPSVRKVLTGMPVMVHGSYNSNGSRGIHTFGLDAKVDGQITVHWGVEVPAALVDFNIWRKVPLSEYHLEREASGGAA